MSKSQLKGHFPKTSTSFRPWWSPRRYGPTTARNPIPQRAIGPVRFRGEGSANRCRHREYQRLHPSSGRTLQSIRGANLDVPSPRANPMMRLRVPLVLRLSTRQSHADPSSRPRSRNRSAIRLRSYACLQGAGESASHSPFAKPPRSRRFPRHRCTRDRDRPSVGSEQSVLGCVRSHAVHRWGQAHRACDKPQ